MEKYDAPNHNFFKDYLTEGRFTERQEPPDTPEIKEAMEIASRKLERLLDSDDFCYRYMSIEEYREIMKTGHYEGEVNVNNPQKRVSIYGERTSSRSAEDDDPPLSFREFVAQRASAMIDGGRGREFWANEARDATDWEWSTASIHTQNFLVGLYKRAHSAVGLDDSAQKGLDRRTLTNRKFRDKLEGMVTWLREDAAKIEKFQDQFAEVKVIDVAMTRTDAEKEFIDLQEEILHAFGEHAHPIIEMANKRAKQLADSNKFFSEYYRRHFQNVEGEWVICGLEEIVFMRGPKFSIKTADGKCVVYNNDRESNSGWIFPLPVKTEEELEGYLKLIERYEYLQYQNYFFGEDHIRLIQKFMDEPQSVPIRDVIHTISLVQRGQSGIEWKQYMLLAVFSRAVVGDSGGYKWGTLKDEGVSYMNREKLNPGDHFLAAISLLPNKELSNELVATSAHGGAFAHPVFDHNGRMVFPKKRDDQEAI